MSILLPEGQDIEPFSAWQDEVEYAHIKLEYEDRKALYHEARNKQKALEETTPDNPLYHRIAVSAEMARMRLHMAYMLNENKKLTQMIGSISWLHEQVAILQGAYGHIKMLAATVRIDYDAIAKGLSVIAKLKEELTNAVKPRSDKPDGAEG